LLLPSKKITPPESLARLIKEVVGPALAAGPDRAIPNQEELTAMGFTKR